MNSKLCCGKEQDGNFCSFCGKKLKSDPLLELLMHCKKNARNMKTKLSLYTKKVESFNDEKMRAYKKAEPHSYYWHLRSSMENLPKYIQKWEERAEALEKLMNSRSS